MGCFLGLFHDQVFDLLTCRVHENVKFTSEHFSRDMDSKSGPFCLVIADSGMLAFRLVYICGLHLLRESLLNPCNWTSIRFKKLKVFLSFPLLNSLVRRFHVGLDVVIFIHPACTHVLL